MVGERRENVKKWKLQVLRLAQEKTIADLRHELIEEKNRLEQARQKERELGDRIIALNIELTEEQKRPTALYSFDPTDTGVVQRFVENLDLRREVRWLLASLERDPRFPSGRMTVSEACVEELKIRLEQTMEMLPSE